MSERNIILNRLLDKYENSKHLSEPGTSLRRVMLRVVKKELSGCSHRKTQRKKQTVRKRS